MLDLSCIDNPYRSYFHLVENYCLFDDIFARYAFDTPAIELILRIITGHDHLHIIDMHKSYEVKNIAGRSVVLDIFAKDECQFYNIEMQKYLEGMHLDRACFHSEMIGVKMRHSSDSWIDRVSRVVIFFVDKDIFHKNKPIYYIQKTMDGEVIDPKEMIIYVNMNVGFDDGTELGELKHDLLCKQAKDAYFKEIRDVLKRTKEETKGVKDMCKITYELVQEGEKRGKEEGSMLERIANAKAMLKNGATIEFVKKCIQLPLEQIQQLAEEL